MFNVHVCVGQTVNAVSSVDVMWFCHRFCLKLNDNPNAIRIYFRDDENCIRFATTRLHFSNLHRQQFDWHRSINAQEITAQTIQHQLHSWRTASAIPRSLLVRCLTFSCNLCIRFECLKAIIDHKKWKQTVSNFMCSINECVVNGNSMLVNGSVYVIVCVVCTNPRPYRKLIWNDVDVQWERGWERRETQATKTN